MCTRLHVYNTAWTFRDLTGWELYSHVFCLGVATLTLPASATYSNSGRLYLVTLCCHCSFTLLGLAILPSLGDATDDVMISQSIAAASSNLHTQPKVQIPFAIPTRNECKLLWSLKAHSSLFCVCYSLSVNSNWIFPSLIY